MKKTILALALTAISCGVYANEIQNLQGYYKSQASISYAANKIAQNKVEFLHLDYALKDLATSNIPQSVGAITDRANALLGANAALASQFNYETNVCVITKDSSKVAYEVDAEETACSSDLSKVSKAMVKKADNSLVFYKQYQDGKELHHYIEEIDGSGETITSRYLFPFKGALVGDMTRITKGSDDKYLVENYSNYGDADTSKGKIGSISYQWANDFAAGEAADVYSVTYMYGSDVAIDAKTKAPFFWASQDHVVLDASGKPIVEWVKRYRATADNSKTAHSEYSTAAKNDLLTYNFNNKHRLVGLSPDACVVHQIKDGTSPVTIYKEFNRPGDCTMSDSDKAKYTKSEHTSFKNDGNKTVKVSDMQTSASSMVTAIEALSNNSVDPLTPLEYAGMLIKYTDAVKSYNGMLRSTEFWK